MPSVAFLLGFLVLISNISNGWRCNQRSKEQLSSNSGNIVGRRYDVNHIRRDNFVLRVHISNLVCVTLHNIIFHSESDNQNIQIITIEFKIGLKNMLL